MLPLTEETSQRVSGTRPAWARQRAAEGFDAFRRLPTPDPKEEDWRYVDPPPDLDGLSVVAAPGSPLPADDRFSSAIGEVAGTALVVDGTVVSIEGGAGEIRFSSLADAMANGEGLESDVFAGVPADLDRFAAAHRAFATDGVLLWVPAARRVERPFLIEVQATAAGSVSFPHLTVVGEQGAEAAVVVLFRSPDGVELTTVPQIEMRLGDDARIAMTMLQAWGDATYGVTQQRIGVGRDATISVAEAGLGGAGSRLHLTVDLEGRGADARILGVYFGDREQTLDYRYFMNHRAPNTASEMFLKGAVGHHASSVFTGLIRIEPEAQKTDAHQTNRNLVLSDGAEAHSVPNLEILANDVRCGHGSAVGPLDEEQRYYLMSRGLDRVRADRLQVLGFFEDVLSRFPDTSIEAPLSRLMLDKYAGIVAGEAE